MTKDKIKVGDTVRIVKVGKKLENTKGIEIGSFCKVTHITSTGYDIIDLNNKDWYGITNEDYFSSDHSILIEKVETKKERKKKVKQIEEVKEVKEEKPFRIPTTSIRMWYKCQWKNCTSDVELNWDMF